MRNFLEGDPVRGLSPEMQFRIHDWRRQWNNLGEVARENREELNRLGEPLVERLAQGPIPVRIRVPAVNTIPELLREVMQNESGFELNTYLEKTSKDWTWVVFGDKTTGQEHVALIKSIGDGEDLPIRIHSSCITAETFHAANCDCEEQLSKAKAIADHEGKGGIVWLNQEGRGNGTVAKVHQLGLMMEEGLDTVTAYQKLGYPSDQRDYQIAAEILKDLGIKSIRLITNSPDKMEQLQKYGVTINERIPCEIPPINEIVRRDLEAKRVHHGHFVQLNEE